MVGGGESPMQMTMGNGRGGGAAGLALAAGERAGNQVCNIDMIGLPPGCKDQSP